MQDCAAIPEQAHLLAEHHILEILSTLITDSVAKESWRALEIWCARARGRPAPACPCAARSPPLPLYRGVCRLYAHGKQWRGAALPPSCAPPLPLPRAPGSLGILANLACHKDIRLALLGSAPLAELVCERAMWVDDAPALGEGCRLLAGLCLSTKVRRAIHRAHRCPRGKVWKKQKLQRAAAPSGVSGDDVRGPPALPASPARGFFQLCTRAWL